MIDALHGLDERARAHERAAVLTSREREVLDLVAQGARNRQIAAALTISEFTVKRHMQNILQKLELPSRRAAATFYRTAFDQEEVPVAVAQDPHDRLPDPGRSNDGRPLVAVWCSIPLLREAWNRPRVRRGASFRRPGAISPACCAGCVPTR